MPNDFQVNKLIFFNNSNYSYATKKAYWNQYLLYIADLELKFKKDLYNFSNEEIKEYIKAINEKSQNTIRTTNSFISKYMIWYSNYYSTSKKTFDLSIQKQKEFSYISKKKFFKMCDKMLEIKDLDLATITPLIFARYGILGKEAIYMRSVKWENIDANNKKVIIYDNENNIISQIPIDDEFLKWVNILSQYEKALYKGQKVKNPYIIKSQIKTEEIINYASLNTKALRAFNSVKMSRIAFTTLVNCAIIDYLYSVYKDKKLENNEEFYKQISIFYPNEKYNNTKLIGIKKLYLEVTNNNNLRLFPGGYSGREYNRKNLEMNINTQEPEEEIKLSSKDLFRNAIVKDDNITYMIVKKADIKKHIKINEDIINKIKKYKWYFNIDDIVITRMYKKDRLEIVYLSNFILGANKYHRIIFKNDDKYDYRKENLIISEN
jgi:hypothetical protein